MMRSIVPSVMLWFLLSSLGSALALLNRSWASSLSILSLEWSSAAALVGCLKQYRARMGRSLVMGATSSAKRRSSSLD